MNTSRNINKAMGSEDIESANTYSRFHTKEYHEEFIKKYGKNQTKIPPFRWHKSFHDHFIRNEKDFYYHYQYTVFNFQKHCLPHDWPYASLNYKDMIDNIHL